MQVDNDGFLQVTDGFLRRCLERPELAPVAESCPAEIALYGTLVDQPTAGVAEPDLEAMQDPDARDNYRLFLNFRDRLLASGSVEQCYRQLFDDGRPIDFPPLFVDELAQAIVHNILAGTGDPNLVRAGELMFREQTARNVDGAMLLFDAQTYQRVQARARSGHVNLIELLHDPASLHTEDIDVLVPENAGDYWLRSDRHDMALDVTFGRAGLPAISTMLERWVRHFLGVDVTIEPLQEIEDDHWTWHVGLDVAASELLNDLYDGREVDDDRRERLISLFRLTFRQPADMRADIAGRPVYLALCAGLDNRLRLKPQNLLVNLPLARVA
jgi:hypothetical protein